MKSWLAIFPIVFCVIQIASAQEIDSVLIEDVHIISAPIKKIDDRTLLTGSDDQSVEDVLQLSTDIFLKSNGPGSSITTGILGGTASHTTLTIHGVPVTNPLIGQADFSLIPIFFHQSLSLQTGSSDDIKTTGSIAGNVAISDRAVSKPLIKVGSVYRSYRNLESYFTYHLLTNKWDISANVSRLDAKNSFRYRLDGIDATFIQSHAENTSTNAYLSATYHLTDNQSIQGWYWWQDQDRNIPPTTVQILSTQRQEDRFHKGGLIHRYQTDNLNLTSKIGYTDQEIFFEDPQILRESLGAFTSQYYESILEMRKDKDVQLSLGYQGDISLGQNSGFAEDSRLMAHRFLFGLDQNLLPNQTNFLVRVISSNLGGDQLASSGYLSHARKLHNGARIKGSLRKLWRAPSLNDLFWSFGGDPNLSPERGWEVNAEYSTSKDNLLSVTTNLFSRWVSDYIIWAPSEELGGFFGASNISTVWSRGILVDLDYRIALREMNLSIKNTHSLIYSSPDETVESTFLTQNAQLIYTPIYSTNLVAQLQRNRTSLRVNTSLTTQYTGINEDVDGYTIVDAGIHHSFDFGRGGELQVGVEMANVFDVSYVIVERRPVPGRYLKLNFNYIYRSQHLKSN